MKRIAMIDIFRYRLCGEIWRVDVLPDGGKPVVRDDLSWSEAKDVIKETTGVSIVKPVRMKRIDRYRTTVSFVVGEADDGRREAFRIR